jgi:hypothetical protein
LTRSSPADCSSLKGYGDELDLESTRSEKSGAGSWNLLGIRGLEAVQVSSHRGPPMDRPPDKPPPWKGASRGCLQERAGTRHFSQLASSSRGSYCSSGNALPFADNANCGVCAVEQFRVCAGGTSQFSRAELEACEAWSVQGQRGTCVTCGHPPPNLGRDLFPRGVFLPHPSQQVQWHSATTVALTCTTLPPALRAVVRCSQVPRWGQTE